MCSGVHRVGISVRVRVPVRLRVLVEAAVEEYV